MTSTTPLLLLLASSLVAGCANVQPRSGVAPTGEPLSIETWTSKRKETVSEKIGESDHYDSSGEYVGTSEQYRDRTVTRTSFHWQPMQGSSPISDADFYRLAGDEAKAQHALRYRRRGALMTAGGTLALAAGTAIALTGQLRKDSFSEGQALGMYIGGGMLGAAGGFSLAFGIKRLVVDGHPYGYGEALDVLEVHERAPTPPPPVARIPRPAGRTVMLNVFSGRF